MNSGAEAVETPSRPFANGATGQRRAEKTRPRSSSAPTTSTAAPSPSWASAPIPSPEGFGPFTPGFKIIPYGDAGPWKRPSPPTPSVFWWSPSRARPGSSSRPGLSEGRICEKHNVVLILDEIQTGLGRTGKLLAEEHEGIEADLTLVGKASRAASTPSRRCSPTPRSWASAARRARQHLRRQPPGLRRGPHGLRVLVEEGMIDNAAAVAPVSIACSSRRRACSARRPTRTQSVSRPP
jgi:ornithine--oxo-acid transaminase